MGEMGIYKITNKINNMFYIGSSSNLTKRGKEHRNMLNNNSHYNNHMQYSWNKYGSDSFTFEVIEYVKERNDLMDREQYWLDKTKCYERNVGYNIARFADINFRRMSKNDIKQISVLYKKGVHYTEIADTVGVSIATVHAIKNGSIYRSITRLPKLNYQPNKIEVEDVKMISRACKKAKSKDISFRVIAIKLSDYFNISKDTIYDIEKGKTWSEVTGNIYKQQRENKTELEIKLLYNDILEGLDINTLAKKHNVTNRYIQKVIRGEIHSNTTGIKYERKNLTHQQVINIYKAKLKGVKTKELANKFNVSSATINRIANRKIWVEVTENII